MYTFKHLDHKHQSEGNMTSKSKSRLILALSRSTIYNRHNNIVFSITQYEIYFYFYISHLYKIIKYPDDLSKIAWYHLQGYQDTRSFHPCIHTPLCSIQSYNQPMTMWPLKLLFLQTNTNSHREFSWSWEGQALTDF